MAVVNALLSAIALAAADIHDDGELHISGALCGLPPAQALSWGSGEPTYNYRFTCSALAVDVDPLCILARTPGLVELEDVSMHAYSGPMELNPEGWWYISQAAHCLDHPPPSLS
ncbi:hypothetical protein B0T21DRAFT_358101 [Apiosordaria backusii]|uniref:Uncharacterized protein n=1 Tax=Apiosordaria backusii TaxID=314023 RepID=A0AA40ESI5_9PEZI|nr:hypothetical protein B0T21DRAFT_358101 [Apiosordaria backusii]